MHEMISQKESVGSVTKVRNMLVFLIMNYCVMIVNVK